MESFDTQASKVSDKIDRCFEVAMTKTQCAVYHRHNRVAPSVKYFLILPTIYKHYLKGRGVCFFLWNVTTIAATKFLTHLACLIHSKEALLILPL